MTTITIPKELIKDEKLVAVPRKLYEDFLGWQQRLKGVKTFKPTAAEKRALERGRRNLALGKYVTLKKLRYELGLDS